MSSYLPRSLIGQVRDDNANWNLTTRPAMFPFLADYTNRDTGEHAGGLAVPSMVTEPINALSRLFGTPSNPGTFGQGPEYGSNAEDMRTLLETFLGGNTTRGLAPAERAAAVEASAPLRAYRGVEDAAHVIPDPALQPNRSSGAFWGTSSPDVAGSYAREAGAVAPVEYNFQNPMIVDAQGSSWGGIPYGEDKFTSSDVLARYARMKGHDGLVLNNIVDPYGDHMSAAPTNTYAALKPGTVTSPLTGETLFSDQLPSLPGAVIAGAEKNVPGFDVWHGSPHDFDKFDLSKIGTGEGAQVYGRGLYFAENQHVAKGYRDQLSGGHLVGGEPLDFSNPDHVAASFLHDYGPESAARVVHSDASMNPSQKAAVLERLSNPQALPAISGDGYLYQARINSNPESFLDWDKALNQQAQPVTNSVRQAMGADYHGNYDPNKAARLWDAFQNANAGTAIRNGLLASDPSLIASRLKDAGLPGIKYLDAGSRGAADGSRNYVLFDDSLVNTLHKWRGDQQLYSDQLPSLWSSALQGQQNPNSLFNF